MLDIPTRRLLLSLLQASDHLQEHLRQSGFFPLETQLPHLDASQLAGLKQLLFLPCELFCRPFVLTLIEASEPWTASAFELQPGANLAKLLQWLQAQLPDRVSTMAFQLREDSLPHAFGLLKQAARLGCSEENGAGYLEAGLQALFEPWFPSTTNHSLQLSLRLPDTPASNHRLQVHHFGAFLGDLLPLVRKADALDRLGGHAPALEATAHPPLFVVAGRPPEKHFWLPLLNGGTVSLRWWCDRMLDEQRLTALDLLAENLCCELWHLAVCLLPRVRRDDLRQFELGFDEQPPTEVTFAFADRQQGGRLNIEIREPRAVTPPYAVGRLLQDNEAAVLAALPSRVAFWRSRHDPNFNPNLSEPENDNLFCHEIASAILSRQYPTRARMRVITNANVRFKEPES